MLRRRSPLPTPWSLAFAGALALPLAAQREVVETHDNGAVRARYQVDEAGHKNGSYESFRPDGTAEVRCSYADDQLDGRYEKLLADGRSQVAATYKRGQRDGTWRENDEQGRKLRVLTFAKDQLHGRDEEFHPDGRTASVGDWREGKRTGHWVFTSADGQRRKTCEYKNGLLHGPLTIELRDKVLARQKWQDDVPVQLDDLQPFPVAEPALRATLTGILKAKPPADAGDALAPQRHQALARLQAYRALCRLPFANLVLVPEWNAACDAGSALCAHIGHLEHTPPRPPDLDEPAYKLGYEGTSHSNLHVGGGLAHAVDGFMDDSDPHNIDRIGHRRWCLNPAMAKTGFGAAGDYAAMWSMDSSGSGVKGMHEVLYPPAGWCPVDLFGARHAWSITLLRGGAPKAGDLRVTVRALDDEWLPAGEPLELDHCAVAEGGFGAGPCVVFRPKRLEVAPGRRYLVAVSTDAGKTIGLRYLVAFVPAVLGGTVLSEDDDH